MNTKYKIHEYLKKDNSSPFADWLSRLRDKKVRAKVRIRLDRVRLRNLGDCKSIGSKKTQRQDIVKAKQYWNDYKRRLYG